MSAGSKISILFAKVPYWTSVDSVLEDTVVLWQDPRDLPKTPGLVTMVESHTRRVIFLTEFGEGLGSLPTVVLGSEQAYRLSSLFPAFRGPLREKVTESVDAYWWALKGPEERNWMRDRVTKSRHAFWWSEKWPEERHLMRHRVTDPEDIAKWNARFPNDWIPIPR